MANWIRIPNAVVNNFTGKPLRASTLDADLETVYEPFNCPSPECPETFTGLAALRTHVHAEHEAKYDRSEVAANAVMEDATVARMLIGLLVAFNAPDQRNALAAVRKANDAYNSTELWRSATRCYAREAEDLHIREEQRSWLESFLDRKLPLTKEQKDEGYEQQTVALAFFGLAEDNMRQALKPLHERRKVEADPNAPTDDDKTEA